MDLRKEWQRVRRDQTKAAMPSVEDFGESKLGCCKVGEEIIGPPQNCGELAGPVLPGKLTYHIP